MTANQNDMTMQRNWSVPAAYVGVAGTFAGYYAAPAPVSRLSRAMNAFREIDDAIQAIYDAGDAEAAREWRDADWEHVGRETGGDADEASEYADSVRAAFDSMIEAME